MNDHTTVQPATSAASYTITMRDRAYLVFTLIQSGVTLPCAMRGMGVTHAQLRLFLPDWNKLSTKPITID